MFRNRPAETNLEIPPHHYLSDSRQVIDNDDSNNPRKENLMWYFTWILGIGFAVLLAILNTMWGEYEEARAITHRSDAC